MVDFLSPRQFGFGVRGGAECAVHATRKYLHSLPSAFNSVHRDKVLEAVLDLAPGIYPLVHSAYSSPTSIL